MMLTQVSLAALSFNPAKSYGEIRQIQLKNSWVEGKVSEIQLHVQTQKNRLQKAETTDGCHRDRSLITVTVEKKYLHRSNVRPVGSSKSGFGFS